MNFIKFMLILLNLYVNLYGCVHVEKEKGRKRKSRGLTVVGLSHTPLKIQPTNPLSNL